MSRRRPRVGSQRGRRGPERVGSRHEQACDHLLLRHRTRHDDGQARRGRRRSRRRRGARPARRRNPRPGIVRAEPGVDGELRSHQGPAARDRRRHRLGRRGDLRVADAIRFGGVAIAQLPRLAGRPVGGGQARRQGVRGVHLDEHRARRPGDHAAHAVHHADALRRHHRAARIHRCAEVRRRQTRTASASSQATTTSASSTTRPTTRSTTWPSALSASRSDLWSR